VRQLLSMTSGLFNTTEDRRLNALSDRTRIVHSRWPRPWRSGYRTNSMSRCGKATVRPTPISTRWASWSSGSPAGPASDAPRADSRARLSYATPSRRRCTQCSIRRALCARSPVRQQHRRQQCLSRPAAGRP
jgi:hypothetical protein